MYKNRRITVVVPAYNEEALIQRTLQGIPAYVDDIVVVDDASLDQTTLRAEASAKEDPRIRLVRHERNQGVGAAVVDGYRTAIELGSDIAAVMAGDNQMPPEHLPALLDQVIDGGYDMAKGNRFMFMSTTAGVMPRHRLLGNIILTLLTKASSGYWSIFDTQNGYLAVRVETLRRLDLSRIARRYDLENSMLINLNIINARVTDVPIPAVYGEEVSTIRLWKFVPRTSVTLLLGLARRIYLKYVVYNFHPVALFLFSGLALTTWGVAFGIWAAVNSLGEKTASTGTVMLSVLPFLMGFQLLLAAIVLDILNEPR